MPDTDKNSSAAESKKSVSRVGDFELQKKLGKGGMGEVFLARQVSLDRLVALKTLSRELAGKSDFVARFLREARSMAKIDHPNVVKVYAVDSYKGIHFAAIEYVDGYSVQKWLDKLKQFSIADAVHIAMVSAAAMKHAHDLNMVHRDIKPDNILLTSKGVVKVADFGLAKVIDEDVSMTQSGTGLGTPLYMAPEQARSAKTVDQRSDIYALGATLYHMLTGRLPFTGGTALELIISKETGRYDSLKKVRPEVPDKLDLIVGKMMEKDPKHRYADCAEVVKDLAALGVHGESISFISGAAPNSIGNAVGSIAGISGTKNVAGNSSTKKVASAGPPPTSRQDAQGKKKKKPSVTWIVQYEDAKGAMAMDKMSTGRVLKMLEAGIITAKARAKASAEGSYLPLSQFPEFKEAVESSLSRMALQVKHDDLKSLYKQVERDQKKLRRWRWVTGKFRGLVGAVSLVIWIVIIVVVGGIAMLYGRALWEYLGQTVMDMMG